METIQITIENSIGATIQATLYDNGLTPTAIGEVLSHLRATPGFAHPAPTAGSVSSGIVGSPTASQAEQTTMATSQQILQFLASDPRYTLRTFTAILDEVGVDRMDLEDHMYELEGDGLVETKTRRSDGVRMYGITAAGRSEISHPGAPAQQDQASAVCATVTPEAIREFLTSDTRYTVRTRSAIFEHFEGLGVNYEDIGEAIDEAECDELIEERTRRSDGATMYEAL